MFLMVFHRQTKLTKAASPPVAPAATPIPSAVLPPSLRQALTLIAAGQYEKALGLLQNARRGPQPDNLRGVCLLRLGRIDEAVQVYRNLVLQLGGAWTRPELPTSFKVNFATALLLAGQPGGCLDLLAEINDDQNAGVRRLRAAIQQWAGTLSLWQKLEWWLGRIEPANCPVTLDFPPGEVDDDTLPREPQRPPSPRKRAG